MLIKKLDINFIILSKKRCKATKKKQKTHAFLP